MTQRIVNDTFWTDPYIEDLDPSEKLIFIYLLTNPLCNIAWAYEIRNKRIAYETGFDKDMVDKILRRFEKDERILRADSWIIMVNFAKNQSNNPNVLKWMQRIINEIPEPIRKALKGFERLPYFTLLNLTIPNLTKPNSKEEEIKISETSVSIIKENDIGLSEEKIKMKEDIDLLISELKWQSDILWIAYDKNKERMFWKHITTAKEYWDFCEKVWLSRIEFAKNILIASDRVWFWKWVCSWPMSIYQNYSEVYNLIKSKQKWSEIINII